ncbi:hypothetical protein RvY_14340-2 [Ramazzottius varieornatus]|uniref:Uncharacterized protein n=1 Tax=Ramazzottius varieornatus TaxID=947166 RepID=A0A1D1VR03_RAMVA|nr:hypothetical protein RvY_14340-2 [Ramazzottius varieornatus]
MIPVLLCRSVLQSDLKLGIILFLRIVCTNPSMGHVRQRVEHGQLCRGLRRDYRHSRTEPDTALQILPQFISKLCNFQRHHRDCSTDLHVLTECRGILERNKCDRNHRGRRIRLRDLGPKRYDSPLQVICRRVLLSVRSTITQKPRVRGPRRNSMAQYPLLVGHLHHLLLQPVERRTILRKGRLVYRHISLHRSAGPPDPRRDTSWFVGWHRVLPYA